MSNFQDKLKDWKLLFSSTNKENETEKLKFCLRTTDNYVEELEIFKTKRFICTIQ